MAAILWGQERCTRRATGGKKGKVAEWGLNQPRVHSQKKNQGSGGADLSIANTYHVPYHWSCRHIHGLQLQVSNNLNKLHTLCWNSVPEDVELLPIHQDLSEDKAERSSLIWDRPFYLQETSVYSCHKHIPAEN